MFKNLKKKIEDVGSDLSTLASPGGLGSLSSLRHSGSKASVLSASRESVQSESAVSRTILTTPVFEDDVKHVAASSIALSTEEDSVPFDLALEEIDSETSLSSRSSRKKSLDVSASYENGMVALNDLSGSFSEDWHAVQNETVDFSLPSQNNVIKLTDDARLALLSSQAEEMRSVSLVDVPISDTLGPLLSPALVKNSSSHDIVAQQPVSVCDHRVFEDKIAKITVELESKKQELQKSRTDLLSQESARATFRAELERMKDVTAQNRVNEEKLTETALKLTELNQMCENTKLEKDSWKIAHDQAVQRLKEKSSFAQNSAKKVINLEAKLSISTAAAADYQKELERIREENSSLKSTMAILENQIDKFLADLQKEKSLKEKAVDETAILSQEVTSNQELIGDLRSKIEHLENELTGEKTASAKNSDKSNQIASLERKLKQKDALALDERKDFQEQISSNLREHEVLLEKLRAEISQKDISLSLASEESSEKSELISASETSISEFKDRVASLQEELESKEGAMAIYRRRSGRDTETKLRERDRQIANLENQLTELLEEKNNKQDDSTSDGASHEYTKNVLLKFVSGTGDERLQMLKAVSVLLRMSESEETWLKNVILWKQSWLPGPKPELTQNGRGHHVNGSS